LLYPGNYTDQGVNISKNNVTISAISSVVSGMTYDNYGMVTSGTDNRPVFLGTSIPEFTISGSGVTLSYFKIRGLVTGSYLTAAAITGVIEITNNPTTLDHMEA